ncbi:hypothetical protein NDJ64_11165 [Vibrio alginolyticus]|nr:hypothetical protein [Vibrio alginolyticus]
MIAKKHTEAQEQFELWCDYAKKIHAVRDKAVVRAIYECERGIYQASNTMSKWFYHILLIMFEYSQIAKDLVTISPLQEIQAEKIQLDKRQTDLLEPVNHFRNP